MDCTDLTIKRRKRVHVKRITTGYVYDITMIIMIVIVGQHVIKVRGREIGACDLGVLGFGNMPES